ncbi:MAG TPA: ribonuclease P protein component [Tenuifilaceae bacterium]|mgnify:CR=1 FL=1|nr:ribonuclease P protein component [Tenuifilaceae bacterium]HPQ32865.1 ribonuclease P protein component [Tenuifilaceae bacterium]HRX67206.1 ribonuclease P protein component [Tenuifilaceae bacterium]
MKGFGLPKSRILRSKKAIDELFSKGKWNTHYPVKVIYLVKKEEMDNIGVSVLFVVPKKKFKRAVDRNLLRRRMKEVYRIRNRVVHEFCVEKKTSVNIAFLYVSDRIENFTTIQKSIYTLMDSILKNL